LAKSHAISHHDRERVEKMFSDTKPAPDAVSAPGREFEFTLKVRIDCPQALWAAAASQWSGDATHSPDDIADMIGPAEDPSIEDCLMTLALPGRLPGCTMLNALLTADGAET
jgi:hypothetical protein